MRYFYFKYVLAACLLVAITSGCEKKPPTEWEDPNPPGAPIPEITDIYPDTGYGGDPVTITGKNFSPDPEKNFVVFGKKATMADSATETTLKVTAPMIGGMECLTVKVNVATQGCVYFSNELDFTFLPIMSIFRDDFSCTRGIEFDEEGNCYVSDPDDWAVYKITPEGGKTVYAEVSGPGDIAFDRDGYLYVCNKWDDEIYRVAHEGGDYEVFTDEIPEPMCIDWDENGNMYVVGSWDTHVWRITPGGEISQLDIDIMHGKSLRVFEGYLYWSDSGDWGEGNNHIMRAPIRPDGLGAPEIVYEDPEWSGTYIWGPSGINIDKEGNVYAVSRYWDGCPNLARFNTDGTAEVIVELPTSNNKFIAFLGKDVYITTQWEGLIYKVYVGVEGAPPYGWGLLQ